MDDRSRKTVILEGFIGFDPFDQSESEKNLLRAILVSAMNDLKYQGEIGKRAKEFFLNPDDKELFSFQSICNYLNYDPFNVLKIVGLLIVDESGKYLYNFETTNEFKIRLK